MTLPVAKTTMPSACFLWQNPSSLRLALQRAAERHHVLCCPVLATLGHYPTFLLLPWKHLLQTRRMRALGLRTWNRVFQMEVGCGRHLGVVHFRKVLWQTHLNAVYTCPCLFHSPEAPVQQGHCVPSAPGFGGLIPTEFSFFKRQVE